MNVPRFAAVCISANIKFKNTKQPRTISNPYQHGGVLVLTHTHTHAGYESNDVWATGGEASHRSMDRVLYLVRMC